MIRNRSVWPTIFLLNVFTALKGTHFCIFICNGKSANQQCLMSTDIVFTEMKDVYTLVKVLKKTAAINLLQRLYKR